MQFLSEPPVHLVANRIYGSMILKYYIQIIVDWTLLSIRYKYLIQDMVSPVIDFLHKPLGLQQSIHHPELSLPTSSAFYQSLMYSL